jgi:ferric-dicitrate binding protein FerR (iron transport regulator)
MSDRSSVRTLPFNVTAASGSAVPGGKAALVRRSGTTVVVMVNSDIQLDPACREENPTPSISAQLIEAMNAP